MKSTMRYNDKAYNFPSTIHDKELSEGVTYLTTRDTNLSADIIVDSGETYKHYSHPLCLFVVDGETVHPITISPNPSAIGEYEIPDDILLFITQNISTLIDFANMTIDGSKFYTSLRAWKKQTRMNSTETIYQRYLQKKGDCQEYKAVIDYFIYLHEDEGINEMPIEALDKQKTSHHGISTKTLDHIPWLHSFLLFED